MSKPKADGERALKLFSVVYQAGYVPDPPSRCPRARVSGVRSSEGENKGPVGAGMPQGPKTCGPRARQQGLRRPSDPAVCAVLQRRGGRKPTLHGSGPMGVPGAVRHTADKLRWNLISINKS